MRIWVTLFLILALSASPIIAAEQFDRKTELARLKEHFVGKVVTAKMDLPRTDGGFVFVNDGELDMLGLAEALRGTSTLGVEAGGIGVPKGSDVIIGDVKLKPKFVQIYLGTTKGSEWSKALSTMSGYDSTPHSGTRAEPISGAVVVVVKGATRSKIIGVNSKNARLLTLDDLSIESLNESLNQIVDTRNVASVEGLSLEQQEAIAAGDVVHGMTKKAVFLALGEPLEKKRNVTGEDLVETWIYENDRMETTLVLITNGVVTEVKRF